MTMRRVFVGLTVAATLAVFAFVRPGAKEARAQTADPVCTTDSTEGGGNYDEAAQRYKNNQSRHWRQVAIGTH